MQSHRLQLMNHCSWVLLCLYQAAMSAGLLVRRIKIASDEEAFITLKRLDRKSLQSPVVKKKKWTGFFFLGDTGALTQSILTYRCSQNNHVLGKWLTLKKQVECQLVDSVMTTLICELSKQHQSSLTTAQSSVDIIWYPTVLKGMATWARYRYTALMKMRSGHRMKIISRDVT